MRTLIDETYDFARHGRLQYGFDAFKDPLIPEPGWGLVPEGTLLQEGDKLFDIYKGWIESDGSLIKGGYHAFANGQRTGWERKFVTND